MNENEPHQAATILEALRAQQGFSALEKQLAAFILNSPAKIAHMSVRELAAESGASTAAVIRLARKSGTDGYAAFRNQIAAELAKAAPESEAQHALLQTAARLEATAKSLTAPGNELLIEDACTILLESVHILFAGFGIPLLYAKPFCDTLPEFGKIGVLNTDPAVQFTLAASLRKKDTAVLFYNKTKAREFRDLSDILRFNGVSLIFLSDGACPAAEPSELCFNVGSDPTGLLQAMYLLLQTKTGHR